MRHIGIFNGDGGTFRTMDLEDFCSRAREVFARHGHELDCRVVSGKDIEDELRAAAKSGDVIVAGGGDGTVSTAAEIAFETGTPLAVLPAGTMNLFARALGIPLDLDAALEVIASGEVEAVDIATANGMPFIHQFAVGIHTRLVRIREELVYRSRIGKIVASLRAIVATVFNPPRFHAEVQTPSGVERRAVSGITVSNNPIGEGHIPYADRLDTGLLGVYIARPMKPLALAQLAISVMIGRWKANPLVSEKQVQQVTLRFPRRRRSAQAVVDGELIDLDNEVVLKIHPGALKVVVARTVAAEPAAVA